MDYVLLHKDTPVLRFSITRTEETVNLTTVVHVALQLHDILRPDLVPLSMKATEKGLKNWLLQRKIPNNRAYVDNLLDAISDTENPYRYLEVTYGLSLNDTYWVRPDSSPVIWQDVNLYDNPFSDIVANIAFTGEDSQIQGIVTTPEFTTNGMLKKCWHREDGEIYLYKGSTPRYANGGLEALIEVYTSQIADAMGIAHVPYHMTTFHDEQVCASPLFTSESIGYVPIANLLSEPLSRDELMLHATQIDIGAIYGIHDFTTMMVFDALIHNTDRHLNNFGVLVHNDSNTVLGASPLFDHGNSLFYNITDDEYDNLDDVKDISFWGNSFDTLAKLYLHDSHRNMLIKLLDFSFNRIPSPLLTDDKLDRLETYIRARAAYFIDLLNSKVINFATPPLDLEKAAQV